MSWGSLNMAGTTLGPVLSLLFLASITEGHQDAQISCSNTVEAVVGQTVALPCAINIETSMIFSTEWTRTKEKSGYVKLAVFSPKLGLHQFRPNVSITSQNMSANNWTSFPLHLSAVTKWDSRIYVCDITGFPFGSLRCETELKVEDIDKISCDVNGIVEAHSGENVTIRCQAVPGAQYRWTKDNNVVSEEESLELWQVTDAHTGVYTLTVNTGSRTLREEFSVAVLTATTRPTTALVTSPPAVTTQGSMHSTAISLATTVQPSPSTERSPTATSETRTANVGANVTDPAANASGVAVTAEGSVTPLTDDAHSGVTASATAHTETYRLLNSTTLSSRGADPMQETVSDDARNESATPSSNPDDVSRIMPEESSAWGNITETAENYATERKIKHGKGAQDDERSHLLALIMVPMLLLIVVVGLLVRRHIIKQRMDLPPPFKPPPPPVKYTGAVYKHHEILSSYPVSRCNSLAECI